MRPIFFAALIYTVCCHTSCKKERCESCADTEPLIAIAGSNQVVTLPKDSVLLDGSASYAKGKITSYRWSKISGPPTYTIVHVDSAKTIVKTLHEGVYKFELKVKDNKGAEAKDTIQVTVGPFSITTCNFIDRPRITTTLTQIGTLSEPRSPAVGAAGSKVVFAGGWNAYVVTPDPEESYLTASSVIDIYDVHTRIWSTTQLSEARAHIATISHGNKIFFAGGRNSFKTYDNVDIYDVVTNTWSVAHLSEARGNIAAASVGNKVFFAGGSGSRGASNMVDIYDVLTDQWTTATLSVARHDISAVTAGSKIFFAGGSYANGYSAIDIYDNTSNTWSTSYLQYLTGNGISGIAFGENIYWAGTGRDQYGNAPSHFVEIRNISNESTTGACLSSPRFFASVVLKNNDIVFLSGVTGGTQIKEFDIYNSQTGIWSIGILNEPIIEAGIVSLNNNIYIGGGGILNTANYSNKVFRLDW